MIAVKLQTEALDELNAKAAKVGKSQDVSLVGARAVANLCRNHLFTVDNEEPNKLGGPRTHFFSAAAKSIEEPELEAGGAGFTINQVGLAQRWLGGDIEAGRGTSSTTGGPTKYLAIPARAEAYGKAPGEFDDLEFIPLGNRKGMLVEAMQSRFIEGKKSKSGARDYHIENVGGLVMFWLVPKVHQEADPDVMPTNEDMAEAARYAMDNYLTRILQSN